MLHSEVELETIVAVATPRGRGGVGVVRISGQHVTHIAASMVGKLPSARQATLATFKDQNNNTIDQGLVIYFPKPHSFTGEDVLELHAHGGPVVMQLLLDAMLIHPCVRQASAGEFSQRAFLNNKIDLLQAEAIADLIDSHSKTAARCAARSLQGEFSKKINTFIQQLIELRMFVESAIDFPDEDIEFIEQAKIKQKLLIILDEMKQILTNAEQGCLLRDGVSLVILGEPNVGKSSLLNALAEQDVAIVTGIAGTTRDVLQQKILLDDIPIHLIDTAGICQTRDVVEQAGIERAWQQVAQADLILHMRDATQLNENGIQAQLNKHSKEGQKIITVNNKIDLTNLTPQVINEKDTVTVNITVKNKQGLDLLKTLIKETIGFNETASTDYLARGRHVQALKQAKEYIQRGLSQLKNTKAVELLAEDLRLAQQVMSEITGEFTSDDLLGEIFSKFCVGK